MFEYDARSHSSSNQDFDFTTILQQKWNDKHKNSNIFRYQLGELQEKFQGYFLLRLNPDRNAKRRKPEQISNILQPFAENKFNFCKVNSDEILFKFWRANQSNNKHALLVNVSPLSPYHSLLCPSLDSKLPQIATMESLELVLDLYFTAGNRDLRIGFNSLCGLASVNHLHYHIFIESQDLPVENVEYKHLKGPVWIIHNYPVPAFCFDIISSASAPDIFKLIEYLLKNEIAHNVFVTRGKTANSEVTKVLIWPRKSSAGAKQLSAFNVAVCELSGWLTVYSPEDYESLTQDDLERELCKWNLDNFDELCENIKEIF